MTKNRSIVAAAFALVLVLAGSSILYGQGMQMPFGTQQDVKYAQAVWKTLQKYNFIGPQRMTTRPVPGKAPHGAVVETFRTRVRIKGATGDLHVKLNYGGEGITPSKVANNRDQYLKAVTIMFQRESGYDPDNANWFWAKYLPDGSLDKNPKGMPLAGRVAKGMNQGCIACHTNAEGGDYLFLNSSYID